MTESLILSHPQCLAHEPGHGHPESPARLQALLEKLKHIEEAPRASDDQILLAHDAALLAFIRNAAPETGLAQIDADTVMSPASLDAALCGSGAACLGIDRLMQKQCRHVFCATRPPGHHATRSQSMGFCLFNHIAIAAIYARQRYGLQRIAIVDFDVHHGNGTQDIVTGTPGLFYLSTHQSPCYPGTGHISENSPGNILNVPLQAGTDHQSYLKIFAEQIVPALNTFKPELLLVSAGFDAHRSDPLASLALNEITYHWLGEQLGNIARQHCHSRMLSTLEGGYNTRALADSVQAYLEGLEKTIKQTAIFL